jgi:hypothetical protein
MDPETKQRRFFAFLHSKCIQYDQGSGLPGHICREGPHAFQEVGTIAALHILHDHAEMFPGLEAAVHGHHEGIVGEGHDVPLGKDLLHLHINPKSTFG